MKIVMQSMCSSGRQGNGRMQQITMIKTTIMLIITITLISTATIIKLMATVPIDILMTMIIIAKNTDDNNKPKTK